MSFDTINKIIGYILLAVGLLLIMVPLYQTYNIFSGKTPPPVVFKTAPVSEPKNTNPFDIGQQVQNAVTKALPIDLINSTLNLVSWMILLVVLMFGGGQIANLGIKLLKANL